MSVSMSKSRKSAGRRLPAAVPGFPVKRYTVPEYLKLLEHGAYAGSRVELWEGWVVDRMTHGSLPSLIISLLNRWFSKKLPDEIAIRPQLPVSLRDSCPEPDLSIVLGPETIYDTRHPEPQEILLLIEVSDSTLKDDRDIKGRIYAKAGVPAYWIINCDDRQVEIYTDPHSTAKIPRYRKQITYLPGQSFPVMLGGKKLGELAVNTLFPKKKSS